MSTAESTLLAGLNPSQVSAVTHVDGPLLVLAGPGSGKTRVITHRIAYMIEQGIAPTSILGLTFTNKAAQEMRSRLKRLVGHDDVWLGTFHSFCVSLLRRYARLVGLPENFSIYDTNDSEAALKQSIAKAKFELSHTTLGALANRISYFKNRLVTPEVLQAEALSSEEHAVSQVYPFYQQQLIQCGAVDFDDILMHVAILLRSHPELRQQLDQRYRYVMVDEYQDTNLAQYVIIRHLCVDHPNLAATGDPDQSIYGWRGANLKNVAHLERDYPDLRVIRLENNYRSTPEILSVADCLIQNNEFRKEKVLLPSRESGRPVRLCIYPTARQEAEDVADQIAAFVSEGDYHLRDVGILYRTNAQSRLIEQSLLRRQMAYQLIGGFRFYLRKEIKDLVAYLLLVNNPADDMALDRAINIPPRGIGKQTIEKLSEIATRKGCSKLEACRAVIRSGELSKRATTAIASFIKIYDQLCSESAGPLVDLLEVTIELTEYREFLAKSADNESDADEVAVNLNELLAEAHELDQSTDENRSALEAFLEFAALQSDTDRLKSDSDVVTVMTLHAAKGLEFPIVFIVALEENILPHARTKDDPMAVEEERRLLFVGITRAKDHLQLSCAKSRGFGNQGSGIPSSFLMELPRSEMAFVDRTENLDDFYAGSSGFGDDDYCQLQSGDEYSDGYSRDEFDDACQLPADEMRNRLGKIGKRVKLGSQLASELAGEATNAVRWQAYRVGCYVLHSQFGRGRIAAVSGNGPKRAVTVDFDDDASRRTFRLSHVTLTLENEIE
jgi:DNA helicase II / ATP-dependent DNA helicase PcrA